MTKARRYRKRFYKRKYPKYKRKTRGMQRIKSVRWPIRNIGGDRAYCKLLYVTGNDVSIVEGTSFSFINLCMNMGAAPAGSALEAASIRGVFGSSPNLSTMGALYTKYRIRGVKLRLTFWQYGGSPVFLFTQAATNNATVQSTSTAPDPPFNPPSIAITPEQRWAKTRVCSATAAGGRATTLSAYYSVNRVQGPDLVVKNDSNYTGQMEDTAPFFSDNSTSGSRPVSSPWLQYGIAMLNGQNAVGQSAPGGVLKVQATVYCEFFGKRLQQI